jgi:hypothetical protein
MNRILLCLLPLFGCDLIAANPAALNSFVCANTADCTDPVVQDRVQSLLTDGVVQAKVTCTGIALGGPGQLVSVRYVAKRLQDGGCWARVDLSGPAPVGTGFAQSSGSDLTERSSAFADECPVVSFHPPMLQSRTSTSGGVVTVESPWCAPGGCQMLASTTCSGDLGEF